MVANMALNETKKASEWKKELKLLKLQQLEKQHPDFFKMSGGYEMKIIPYKDDTANGLTRCIVDWITFSGGYANRINTQGQVRIERLQLGFGKYRDNVRRTKGTSNLGTGDIHAIIKSRHVSIEVKIGKDRMSDNQLKEMERVTRAGGLYYVARDMQSFVDWYKKRFELT